MWFPPQELQHALVKLRMFAESLNFRDFEFSAVAIDGNLCLRCDWGDAHSIVSISPLAFETEEILMLAARSAIVATVTVAMDTEARVTAFQPQKTM